MVAQMFRGRVQRRIACRDPGEWGSRQCDTSQNENCGGPFERFSNAMEFQLIDSAEAVQKNSGTEKQRRFHQAMPEHVNRSATQRDRIEQTSSNGHEPHVTDGGVR